MFPSCWNGAATDSEDHPQPRLIPRPGRPEIQVLRLLAEGHTNAEISRRLYLSLRTVEAHRGQLHTKLGLHTPRRMSTYAGEHGPVR